MQNIKLDTGLQTYRINDACEVSFNPTDSGFVKRLYTAFDELKAKYDAYTAEVEAKSGSAALFDVIGRLNAETREIIDWLFEKPVCESVFGAMNVYALADGLPVWMILMLAVLDVVDAKLAQENERANPRLEKYLTKYRKGGRK